MNVADHIELELSDLGDAAAETKQTFTAPRLPDNTYGLSWH